MATEHETVRLSRRHPRARDRCGPRAALAVVVLAVLPRWIDRRGHVLRPQRLHHHHDAVAVARAELGWSPGGGRSSGDG